MRLLCFCLALSMLAGSVRADDLKPDDLKKRLDETLNDLKDVQNRKAALSAENEKLAAQVADLQKQLQGQAQQITTLKQQAALFADRTFFLRSHYLAWTQFISNNPGTRLQWESFLSNFIPLPALTSAPVLDSDWPLSAKN